MKSTTSSELPDHELLEHYRSTRDETAARVLLERHYDTVFKRLRSKLDHQDAEDCAQLLWTRFFNNVDNYEESGRFEHFLSASVTNILKEFWRNKSTASKYVVSDQPSTDDQPSAEAQYVADGASIEDQLINNEMIGYLVNTLIPDLPAEQRMLWLLNHEAEFWDPQQPLSWDTLAQLNGITSEEAWDRFEQARNLLMAHYHAPDKHQTISPVEMESLLIYLVWTQAHRPDKRTKFTMKYFSSLLNESENTLKTRYRAARSRLDKAMSTQFAVA